jgi:hypothetical protein
MINGAMVMFIAAASSTGTSAALSVTIFMGLPLL